MFRSLGVSLLFFVLIGIGTMLCAYPSDVMNKTLSFYGSQVPGVPTQQLNLVGGALMILTACIVAMGGKNRGCWVQFAMLVNIALHGMPFISVLNQGEQMVAMFTLVKSIAIIGGSLLL